MRKKLLWTNKKFFSFSTAKTEKKNQLYGGLMTPTRYLFSCQLKNIGEKIRRFVFGKFVKTCHELDNS